MSVDLPAELEARLRHVADREAIPLDALVGRILAAFLDARDEEEAWRRASRARLAHVWPPEDFSDWRPPDG